MVSEVDFRVLMPGVAVNFGLSPGKFVNTQFHTVALDPLLPPSNAWVIAAAEDCGYGTSGLGKTRINASPAEWLALAMHLARRRQLVHSTLDVVAPIPGVGSIKKAQFAKFLESSEKTNCAFVLGMLYARLAAERWFMFNGMGDVLMHFWHYSILHNPAVSLQGLMPAPSTMNPDFVLGSQLGKWSTLESKGTFGTADLEKLRDGLEQANKFSGISITWPGAVVSTHPIGERSCTLTYFNALDELQSMQLTLPPPLPALAPPVALGAVPGPVIFAPAAEFVRYLDALGQLDCHRGETDIVETDEAGIAWYRSVHVPGFLFGVSPEHRNAEGQLKWAVAALGLIMPVIAKLRSGEMTGRALRTVVTGLLYEIGQRAASVDLTEAESSAWSGLVEHLQELMQADARVLSWTTVLDQVWSAPVLGGFNSGMLGSPIASLDDLWNYLDVKVTPLRLNKVREARLGRIFDAPGAAGTGVTTHGLFVKECREAAQKGPHVPRF